MEASSNASITGDGFEKISKTIREVFPDAVVAPSLSIATTDSRHFTKIVKDTYRFLPVRMDRSILSGMHGTNERLSARSFSETILFYEKLLEKN
jgi:carboxypeptidase PM20D1